MEIKQDLGDRKTYIGGSDIGAIMGASKYRTPVQVYYEKIGEAPEFEGNDATHWGQILEAVVAAEYARRTEQKVTRDMKDYRHMKYPYMVGHIDRRVLNAPGGKGLEVKTAGKWFKPQDWEDEPPLSYRLQVQWYMGLTGWDNWDLAALLAGQDFRIYNVARNEELIGREFEAAAEFWDRVQTRRPPAPQTEDDCKLLWALDNSLTVVAPDGIEIEVRHLAEVQAKIKELEKEEADAALTLKAFMEDNQILVDIAGQKLATWKNNQGLDEDRLVAEHPEETAPFIVQKLKVTDFKKANAKLAKAYTKASETRVFRLA